MITKYKTGDSSIPEDFSIADSEEDIKKKIFLKPIPSKPELDADDKLLEMANGLKKGKKAAKIRTKEIAMDIIHLQKKKQRIGEFLQLEDDIILNLSILALDARMELLTAKKNKLNTLVLMLSSLDLAESGSEKSLSPEKSGSEKVLSPEISGLEKVLSPEISEPEISAEP